MEAAKALSNLAMSSAPKSSGISMTPRDMMAVNNAAPRSMLNAPACSRARHSAPQSALTRGASNCRTTLRRALTEASEWQTAEAHARLARATSSTPRPSATNCRLPVRSEKLVLRSPSSNLSVAKIKDGEASRPSSNRTANATAPAGGVATAGVGSK